MHFRFSFWLRLSFHLMFPKIDSNLLTIKRVYLNQLAICLLHSSPFRSAIHQLVVFLLLFRFISTWSGPKAMCVWRFFANTETQSHAYIPLQIETSNSHKSSPWNKPNKYYFNRYFDIDWFSIHHPHAVYELMSFVFSNEEATCNHKTHMLSDLSHNRFLFT